MPQVRYSAATRVTGPMIVKARKPVTSIVMSGVSRKSAVPLRTLCRLFSMRHMT